MNYCTFGVPFSEFRDLEAIDGCHFRPAVETLGEPITHTEIVCLFEGYLVSLVSDL